MKCCFCYEQAKENFHTHCSLKFFGRSPAPTLNSSLDEIDKIATQFINQRLTVTGVQRKLSLSLPYKKDRFTIVGSLGGSYILKPPSNEFPEMPENEDLIMKLAKICKIKTAQHSLIRMADGTIAYLAKRFDRTHDKKSEKIAVEDLCQLMELPTEQKYTSSHEKLGKTIQKYSSVPGDDGLRLFELIVFSFLVGNADMHLKNFSMMTEDHNFIHLSPAYDLVSTRLVISEKDDSEELALTLNGKKKKLKLVDFIEFARKMNIKEKLALKVIKQQGALLAKSKDLIFRSFLSKKRQQELISLVESRTKLILPP